MSEIVHFPPAKRMRCRGSAVCGMSASGPPSGPWPAGRVRPPRDGATWHSAALAASGGPDPWHGVAPELSDPGGGERLAPGRDGYRPGGCGPQGLRPRRASGAPPIRVPPSSPTCSACWVWGRGCACRGSARGSGFSTALLSQGSVPPNTCSSWLSHVARRGSSAGRTGAMPTWWPVTPGAWPPRTATLMGCSRGRRPSARRLGAFCVEGPDRRVRPAARPGGCGPVVSLSVGSAGAMLEGFRPRGFVPFACRAPTRA